MAIPKELGRFGVVNARTPQTRRLIACGFGECGVGKSDLMLRTAPRPLLAINLDRNMEGLEDRYKEDDSLMIKDIRLPRVPNQEEDERIWTNFRELYETATSKGLVRSILLDTGDELYKLLVRAKVGELEFGDPKYAKQYGVVGSNMKWVFDQAKDSRINLLVTHKVEDDYVEGTSRSGRKISVKSGKRKMSGWKNAAYECQMLFEMFKDVAESGEDRYKLKILKCNGNPDVEDEVLQGSEITWATLGKLAAPWTDISEWK